MCRYNPIPIGGSTLSHPTTRPAAVSDYVFHVTPLDAVFVVNYDECTNVVRQGVGA